MSFEKISEQYIRLSRVNSLKKRLLDDIRDELQNIFEFICDAYPQDPDPNKYGEDIDELRRLYALRGYLSEEYSLMGVNAEYPDDDVVIYNVDLDAIEYFLQDDGALHSILFAMRRTGRGLISPINENFFQYSAYTILDRCIWANNKNNAEVKPNEH